MCNIFGLDAIELTCCYGNKFCIVAGELEILLETLKVVYIQLLQFLSVFTVATLLIWFFSLSYSSPFLTSKFGNMKDVCTQSEPEFGLVGY